METHMPKSPCECPQCRRSNKKSKKIATRTPKDNDKEDFPVKSAIPPEIERQYCSDHRTSLAPKKAAPVSDLSKPKDKIKKPASTGGSQKSRGEKVNDLLKADSVADVFEVFKLTETTSGEHDLAQCIQDATAQCKLYAESRAKIIDYCGNADLDLDAVFGLLAKFRQERSLLTSAIIKSNSEREKYMSAICEAEDFMRILRDLPKDGDPEKLQYKVDTIYAKIHSLASDPCQLYEELLDMRDEHMDLLADHEEQHQKFLEIETCHEKLHEDKKKLQDELAAERREHLETRRKLSALQSTKNEVNQAHKSLEKVQEDNADLHKELDKLTAELAKINALKHENTQLKKKLATAEAVKVDPNFEAKAEQNLQDLVQPTKKKKGKKGAGTLADVSPTPTPSVEQESKADAEAQKELKTLKQANAEIQSQLDFAQTNLRQLEVLLKKAELAKTKALEQQQIEKATAQSWEQLSESHLEESTRLKEQLEQSITEATTLQNRVHSLEQSLAEVKEQIQRQKRSASPSATSQTSAMSKFDSESVRLLRKLRSETAQLVMDLDTAKNYPGDPWNLVECTRNLVAGIDRDLEGIITTEKEPNPIPETYMPYPRSDLGLQTPIGLSRIREATPPLSTNRPPPVPSYRPLLPPGLAEPSKASPKTTHFPSPIGTGRPSRTGSGLTPSPTQHPIAPAKSVGFGAANGASLGNGGVDWSIWTRR